MGLSLTTNLIGSGGGSDANFIHTQAIASISWTINHGLGKYPSVVIIDNFNNAMIADIQYTSINNVTITFAAPSTGKAIFN